MANIEAHRYDLLKGMEGRGPSMLSVHGSNNSSHYGAEVGLASVTHILEETQPAALTGSNDEGSFGYEKLRNKYLSIRSGENKPAKRILQAAIRRGEYVVGTAAHQAVALIKSKPSEHADTRILPSERSGQDPRAVWIETIAVLPNAVSNGIGSAILHDVLGNYPDEARVVCGVLGPYEDNPIATWLEDKLGFQQERQTTHQMWDDTVGISYYIADSVGLVRATLEESDKFALIEQPINA